MKQIVLTKEQMSYLKELGLDISNASMIYSDSIGDGRSLGNILCSVNSEASIFACSDDYRYTLYDIIKLLPSRIDTYYLIIKPNAFEYYDEDGNNALGYYLNAEADDNLLDAGYRMLCWCIEKKYINNKKQ